MCAYQKLMQTNWSSVPLKPFLKRLADTILSVPPPFSFSRKSASKYLAVGESVWSVAGKFASAAVSPVCCKNFR